MSTNTNTPKPAEKQEPVDYKQSYVELLEWITQLKPYCYTCLNDGDDDACDMCDRKSFNWVCDPSKLPLLKTK